MLPARSCTTQAIVIKRRSTGEADRVVTLITPDFAKVVGIAKSCRKLSSKQRGVLEPANLVRLQLIKTKSLPIITQSQVIQDFSAVKTNLAKIRQLSQVLEVADKLIPEWEEEASYFTKVSNLLNAVEKNPGTVPPLLRDLLSSLGYPKIPDSHSILEYVTQLTDRPMRSWQYLRAE